MDLVMKLHNTMSQHDVIMVVVDKLTKTSHFIQVKTTHKATKITIIYMKEVARLHGIPKAIVSNKDSKFIGNFLKGLFKGFGIDLNMSTSLHLHIDG